MLGLPADEGILAVCLLVTFVLNLGLSHIHEPLTRKVYSTLLGLSIAVFVYGAAFFTVIPYSMLGYVCMHVFYRTQ